MKVLYIGGTGEISWSCVAESVRQGHQVFVFNRGQRDVNLPPPVVHLSVDLRDESPYESLAGMNFDVVCQFLAFQPAEVARDVVAFGDRCQQYVLISTASAYQKPVQQLPITEDTPLENPFWEYSRRKAECENVLMQSHANGRINATIVRPSHTYRTRIPAPFFDGDHMAWRILHDKPVPVHGMGETRWTLTHADDFARAFVRLFGNDRALGREFHITSDDSVSWSEIVRAVGIALGKQVDVHRLETRDIIARKQDLEGPLLGDKANSVSFDNTRIRQVIGAWSCNITLEKGLEKVMTHVEKRLEHYTPDLRLDEMLDGLLSRDRPD